MHTDDPFVQTIMRSLRASRTYNFDNVSSNIAFEGPESWPPPHITMTAVLTFWFTRIILALNASAIRIELSTLTVIPQGVFSDELVLPEVPLELPNTVVPRSSEGATKRTQRIVFEIRRIKTNGLLRSNEQKEEEKGRHVTYK
jgi:hypothetical protein